MGELKATPGPWKVVQQPSFGWEINIEPNVAQLERIAHSTKQKTLDDVRSAVGFSIEEREKVVAAIAEQEANAHLIAAAPELYEALLEAEKDLVAAQVNARMAAVRDPRWEGVAEAIQPSIDKARAARAKARGES